MIKNYVWVALRAFWKHRIFSGINLLGLAVGISCFTIIMLYVQEEISYDRFHRDSDRIYRVVKDFLNHDGTRVPDATTPPALMPAMLREIPEIEQATRIFPTWGYKPLLTFKEKTFYEDNFIRVDSTFFDVFSFSFLRGDAKSAFAQPLSVVLTESLARKYFGNNDALGETLIFDNRYSLQVSGIIKDVPPQSHFDFDFLISIRSLADDLQGNYEMDSIWGWYNFYTYIKLKPNTSPASVDERIQAVFQVNQPENENEFYTQPLAGLNGIHLTSHLKWELQPNSDNLYIYVFLTIAFFVIFIAGINYVNLTTSKSALRAKEVGMRKVVGALRKNLIIQFLSESILMSFLAAVLAVGLTEIALPYFNIIIQKELSLFSTESLSVWWLIGCAVLGSGFVSGLYPAFYLSSLQPISAVRKLQQSGRSFFDLRRTLVLFQFTLSIILIFGIITIHEQVGFIQSVKLGFDKEQVIVIKNVGALSNRGEGVRLSLAEIPGVEEVAACDGMIGGQNWTNTLRLKGSDNAQLVNFLSVGHGFLDVLGIELEEGRDFSPEFPADTLDGIILNETAVRQLGISEPVLGKQLVWSEEEDTTYYANIVGVVKDFHFTSLRLEIKPFAFINVPERTRSFAVKMSGPNLRETLSQIESRWASLVPGRPIDYYFLDESIDKLYRSEQNFQAVFSIMTILSVIIACLGLFGLAAFDTEKRTKEIGIRKVLGATPGGVVALLSKEFVKLVLLANLVGWPLAYFVMNEWLQNFAYRIEMSWWIFVLAGGLTLGIALATVSAQAVRAALANPAKSLSYE